MRQYFQALLEVLSALYNSMRPDRRERLECKTCQCPFVAISCTQDTEPLQIEVQDTYVPSLYNLLFFHEDSHNIHATTVQLWDALQKPHQLSLTIPPKQTLVEMLFYGP